MDTDLLLLLVEFDVFDRISSVSHLSEDTLRGLLEQKETVNFDTLTTTELENSGGSSVRMNVHEKDPEVQMKGLFMDYKAFLPVRRRNEGDPFPTIQSKRCTSAQCSSLLHVKKT